MAIGDVYKVLDKQLYGQVECLNVYYYQALTNGITAEDVATLFTNTIISQVVIVQTTLISHTSVEVINLDNVADFHEEVFTPTFDGTIGSASMPSYVSWAFKLLRTDRTVRNGAKRLVGVAESATINNAADPSAIPELEDTANAMAANLDNLSGIVLQPVIYGLPTGAPNNLPLRVVPVSGAQFVRLSSQNSRKNF